MAHMLGSLGDEEGATLRTVQSNIVENVAKLLEKSANIDKAVNDMKLIKQIDELRAARDVYMMIGNSVEERVAGDSKHEKVLMLHRDLAKLNKMDMSKAPPAFQKFCFGATESTNVSVNEHVTHCIAEVQRNALATLTNLQAMHRGTKDGASWKESLSATASFETVYEVAARTLLTIDGEKLQMLQKSAKKAQTVGLE
jgi:hypothetical protein